jgi:hypothetical protein
LQLQRLCRETLRDIAINEFQRIRNAIFGSDCPGSFGMDGTWTTTTGTLLDPKPPFCRATLEKKRGTDQSASISFPHQSFV